MTIEEQLSELTDIVKKHIESDNKEDSMEVSENKDFAGKGLAGTALGLGIAGAYALLQNGGLGGGLFGNGNQQSLAIENATLKASQETDKKLVEVYTANARQTAQLESMTEYIKNLAESNKAAIDALAVSQAKDLQIAKLEGEKRTLEAVAQMNARVTSVENAATIGITNAVNAINCLGGRVTALESMTKLVIPSVNVSPAPMPQYNSWTAPTSPTTA